MARAFERPATIVLPADAAGEGAVLEGLFVPGEEPDSAGAVIAPPHPQMGGSMESPVVTEIAHACRKAGLASLRFNWRGVGASAGEISGDAQAADVDYRAALAFVLESCSGPAVACGYSFGALAALRAARGGPGVKRLVLVAPPTRMLDESLIAGLARDVLIVSGERDAYVDAARLAELAEREPHVRLVIVPEADHFFVQDLTPLRDAVSGFLAS